jgi:hypothetical protein
MQRGGPLGKLSKHRLMAQVYPIEVADGGRTAAQGWNQIVHSPNQLHAAMNALPSKARL